MEIINSLVLPQKGNKLIIKGFNKQFDELFLGKNNYYIDGKILSLDLIINDISEVKSIKLEGKEYDVELSNNYGQLVTNLIRLKYSLDDELALNANFRLGDTSKENEFQNWRQICKNKAKEILDE